MDPFEQKVRDAKGGENWWKPEEGSYIVGRVKDIRDVKTKKGRGKALILEDEKTGKETALWMHTVIQKRFDELNIKTGETVGIKYIQDMGNYKLYSVLVDRPEDEG